MNIRYGTESDKNELKNIWQTCFSDTESFVNWNFEKNFSPENVMLLEADGKIVSNLHLIPYEVMYKEKSLKGVYISAVATLPEHRGRGYSSRLLTAALSQLEKAGADIAFLVPAISGFYERFGFIKICEKQEIFYTDAIACTEKLRPAGAEEVQEIYLRVCENKEMYLKRSIKDTKLILEDLTENTGGKCLMLPCGSAYVMYKEEKDRIKVFELMSGNDEAKARIIGSLSAMGKKAEAELLPVMVKPVSEKTKAEDFLLPRENVYFNLIL